MNRVWFEFELNKSNLCDFSIAKTTKITSSKFTSRQCLIRSTNRYSCYFCKVSKYDVLRMRFKRQLKPLFTNTKVARDDRNRSNASHSKQVFLSIFLLHTIRSQLECARAVAYAWSFPRRSHSKDNGPSIHMLRSLTKRIYYIWLHAKSLWSFCFILCSLQIFHPLSLFLFFSCFFSVRANVSVEPTLTLALC